MKSFLCAFKFGRKLPIQTLKFVKPSERPTPPPQASPALEEVKQIADDFKGTKTMEMIDRLLNAQIKKGYSMDQILRDVQKGGLISQELRNAFQVDSQKSDQIKEKIKSIKDSEQDIATKFPEEYKYFTEQSETSQSQSKKNTHTINNPLSNQESNSNKQKQQPQQQQKKESSNQSKQKPQQQEKQEQSKQKSQSPVSHQQKSSNNNANQKGEPKKSQPHTKNEAKSHANPPKEQAKNTPKPQKDSSENKQQKPNNAETKPNPPKKPSGVRR